MYSSARERVSASASERSVARSSGVFSVENAFLATTYTTAGLDRATRRATFTIVPELCPSQSANPTSVSSAIAASFAVKNAKSPARCGATTAHRPIADVVPAIAGGAEHENVRVMVLGKVRLNRFVRAVRIADEERQLAADHLVEPRPDLCREAGDSSRAGEEDLLHTRRVIRESECKYGSRSGVRERAGDGSEGLSRADQVIHELIFVICAPCDVPAPPTYLTRTYLAPGNARTHPPNSSSSNCSAIAPLLFAASVSIWVPSSRLSNASSSRSGGSGSSGAVCVTRKWPGSSSRMSLTSWTSFAPN